MCGGALCAQASIMHQGLHSHKAVKGATPGLVLGGMHKGAARPVPVMGSKAARGFRGFRVTASAAQASEVQRELVAAQVAQLRAENHQLRSESAAKARPQWHIGSACPAHPLPVASASLSSPFGCSIWRSAHMLLMSVRNAALHLRCASTRRACRRQQLHRHASLVRTCP